MNQYILGINSVYHESSACILENGKLICAVEEERLNRVKHGKSANTNNPDQLPINSIKYCLSKVGILSKPLLSQIDYIGFSFEPKKRYRHNKNHSHPYSILEGDFGSLKGENEFLANCKKVESHLKEMGFKGKVNFIDHHACHAACSFFTSPYEKAASLVIDGIGEFHSSSLFECSDTEFKLVSQVPFPNSLGFLWEKFSKFLGFGEYDAAKVMGLASYGNPSKFLDPFKKIIQVNNSFEIDDTIIRFRIEDYSQMENLFNLPKRDFPIDHLDSETQVYADLASCLQFYTEEALLSLSKKALDTNSENLCLSGGVALNCVANGKLLDKNIYENVFIHPGSNDAGTSIGAAFYVYHQILKHRYSPNPFTPYLGPEYSNDEVQNFLENYGIKYEKIDNPAETGSNLLQEGLIFGWFQGKMEFGPRALGNRSILADPRRAALSNRINKGIKKREKFRPLCPSVLKEHVTNWFHSSPKPNSPYDLMLATLKVKTEKKDLIPAVVHIDGTSRIQAVDRNSNPKFYDLISTFFKATQVPMVLNTSFNESEPIVCSPLDALKTLLKTDIDAVIINDFLIYKKDTKVDTEIPDISLKVYFEKLR
jgi:carbamoyltransferase